MRQLSITFLLIFTSFLLFSGPSYSAIKGGINYTIPTDYSNLSEQELSVKADKYFYLAKRLEDKKTNEDMTNALMLYSVLQNMNPENLIYSVRLGILYDKLQMDRYAKGNLSRAIGINPKAPEPLFYLGEFYYKRTMYRQALKYYKRAYDNTTGINYDLSYRMGDIYEKLGDTKSALKYLNEAEIQSPNPELERKIERIKAMDSDNFKYYSNLKD